MAMAQQQPSAAQVLARIGNDQSFKAFKSPEFDPTQFASVIVDADSNENNTISQGNGSTAPSRAELTMKQMSTYIEQIDGAIQGHITDNRDQLLTGVGGIHELQSDCEALTEAVGEVKKSIHRISKELSEPYSMIMKRTKQLKRVHMGSLLLKKVLKVQMTTRKLKALEPSLGLDILIELESGNQKGVSNKLAEIDLRELAKASEALSEVEDLISNGDMAGIKLVDDSSAFLKRIGDGVRLIASAKLREGLQSLNQADVGGSLQVFHNLNLLYEICNSCVDTAISRVVDKTRLAFDNRTLSSLNKRIEGTTKGNNSRDGDAAAIRQLRRRGVDHAEELASSLLESSLQVWNLQRVLSKKTDPRTREVFLDVFLKANIEHQNDENDDDENDDEGNDEGAQEKKKEKMSKSRSAKSCQYPVTLFWHKMVLALSSSIDTALTSSSLKSSSSSMLLKSNSNSGTISNMTSSSSTINNNNSDINDITQNQATLIELYPALRKAFIDLITRLEHSTSPDDALKKRRDGSGGGGSSHLMFLNNFNQESDLITMMKKMALFDTPQNSSQGEEDENKLDVLIDGSSCLFKQHTTLSNEMLKTVLGNFPTGGGGGGGGNGRDGGSNTLTMDPYDTTSTSMTKQHGTDYLIFGQDETETLLNSLNSLEIRFLNKSYETVLKPVEQMFPSMAGYTNAIPSKHDVIAFMRIIQGELDRSVHGGEITLAPLLLKGVCKAVCFLVTRVEGMIYHSQQAFQFTPYREGTSKSTSSSGSSLKRGGDELKCSRTVEQDHNVQLISLLATLHDALYKLPHEFTSSNATLVSNVELRKQKLSNSSDNGMMDNKGNSSSNSSSLSKMSIKELCAEALKPCLKSLEQVAQKKLLRPCTSAIARVLESQLSLVHTENFGDSSQSKGSSASSAASTEDQTSTYLVNFLEFLDKINVTHMAKWPKNCFFVSKAKAELAQRLTRSFVSHLALVRPISQHGRTLITQDMVTFEMSLAPLLQDNDLGRSGSELHAFKQILFLEDDDESLPIHLTKLLTWDLALYHRNDKVGSSSLRPSTLLHHSLSRIDIPITLNGPCNELKIKPQHLVEWLVAGTSLPTNNKYLTNNHIKQQQEQDIDKENGESSSSSGVLSHLIAHLSVDSGASREAQAWYSFSHCLDSYAARCSVKTTTSAAAPNSDEGKKEEEEEIYKVLMEHGTTLVERYLKGFSDKK